MQVKRSDRGIASVRELVADALVARMRRALGRRVADGSLSVAPRVVYVVVFPPEECLYPQVFVCREAAEDLVRRWPTATVSEQPVLSQAEPTRRAQGGPAADHPIGVGQAVVYMMASYFPEPFYPEVFAESDEAKRCYPDRKILMRPLLDMSHFAPVRVSDGGRSARVMA